MKQSSSSRSEENSTRVAASRPVALTEPSASFVDQRPDAVAQCELAQKIHQSPRMVAQRALSDRIQSSPRMVAQRAQIGRLFGTEAVQRQASEDALSPQGEDMPVQRMGGLEEEEPLQGKFEVFQKKRAEEEELLQGKFTESTAPAQLVENAAPSQNNTGLPDNLKTGIENLSGLAMDDVRVHYNSSKPAQLHALAYTQGIDIHVAPGQEQHLPHEAWHVAQQKQGRVKPTMQMKGVAVNDEQGLEREADIMGARAGMVQMKSQEATHAFSSLRYSSADGTKKRSDIRPNALSPMQFALPPYEFKIPFAYNPQGKKKVYDGEKRPAFSTDFKRNLLGQWQKSDDHFTGISKAGNKEYVRAVTDSSSTFADWVPIDAFQIDHETPWEEILGRLFQEATNLDGLVGNGTAPKVDGEDEWKNDTYILQRKNHELVTLSEISEIFNAKKTSKKKPQRRKKGLAKDPETEQEKKAIAILEEYENETAEIFPTRYGARMYYHDYDNLRPMKGSENAGKGAKVSIAARLPKIGKEQAGVEKFLLGRYITMLDSVQNSFRNNPSYIAEIDTELGTDSPFQKMLAGAEDFANSETMAKRIGISLKKTPTKPEAMTILKQGVSTAKIGSRSQSPAPVKKGKKTKK